MRLAIWIAAGAVVSGAYLYGFERGPQPSMLSNFTSLGAVRAYVLYVLTQIGTPIASFNPRLIALAGATGIAVFAVLAIRLRHLRTDPVYLFPVCLGLQTLGTSAMSSLGRAWMGVDQSMSSRYTTLTLPLWCAIAALAVLWQTQGPALPLWRRRAVYALTVPMILVMLASAVKTTRQSVATAAGHSEIMMIARRGLLSGQSDALLRILFPDVTEIRQRRAVLMRLKLSVFRPSAQPSYPLPGPE
jgi:hypothetical protein